MPCALAATVTRDAQRRAGSAVAAGVTSCLAVVPATPARPKQAKDKPLLV